VTAELAAVLTALAAVFVGVAQCIREVRAYHHAVNSRMDQLLALTRISAMAAGRLEANEANVGNFPTTNQENTLPSQRVRRGHN